MLKEAIKHFFQNKIAIVLLIILGSILWSLTMVKSGICWDAGCKGGFGYWGANGHDGIWHLALSNKIADGSLEMPIFAGENIKNYHLGFDVLLALLTRISGIDSSYWYFQFLPPIFAILIGYLTYTLVLNWKNSKSKAFWATFFVYFGGSFGWVLDLIKNQRIDGESTFWSQQAISTLINPPFALSLILILSALILINKLQKKKKLGKIILISLIFGILIQVKVYAGLLSLAGLFVIAFYYFLKKRDFTFAQVFLISLSISLVLINPFSSKLGGFIEYKPFWFLENMLVASDRLYWLRLYSALMTFKSGGIWMKVAIIYTISFFIFLLGNFGSRIIGIFNIFKRNKLSTVDIFWFVLIFTGIFIPTLFLQKGTPWNTIQFLYYSLFALGIYAGLFIEELFKKKKFVFRLFALVLILLTLPTSMGTLIYHYLPSRPPARLPYEELQVLEFLSNQEDGVVLTYPFDKEAAQAAIENPPRPLYLYESTAYVSAYSEKTVFMEDEVNLNITDFNWQERRNDIEKFFANKDVGSAKQFLRDNNILYIYLVKDQKLALDENLLGLEELYSSQEIRVYKTRTDNSIEI